MIRLKNLKFTESINKQKLIYEEDWLYKLDRITVYIFFSWGFILPFIIFSDSYKNYSNLEFEIPILLFFSLFCAFVIYRKATEKKLKKIFSEFGREENAKLINEYCEKLGYEKYKSSSNIIIYNKEPFININSTNRSSRIFLLKDNIVYFAMLKDNFKLNVPVLFSQIELRMDLKKILKKPVGSS